MSGVRHFAVILSRFLNHSQCFFFLTIQNPRLLILSLNSSWHKELEALISPSPPPPRVVHHDVVSRPEQRRARPQHAAHHARHHAPRAAQLLRRGARRGRGRVEEALGIPEIKPCNTRLLDDGLPYTGFNEVYLRQVPIMSPVCPFTALIPSQSTLVRFLV